MCLRGGGGREKGRDGEGSNGRGIEGICKVSSDPMVKQKSQGEYWLSLWQQD